MKKRILKVFVAMSGGVDSSVAAKMMKDRGFKTVGIFLHFWHETRTNADLTRTDAENKCCSIKAFMDANHVCQKLGVALYTLNFSEIFKKEIVDNFLSEYSSGRTPNPCARCNKLVKLGLLISRAKKMSFDYVASGHYARIKKTRKQKNKKAKFIYKLYRAKDKEKDQSYFLYNLTQEQLKHLIFPLGDFKKEEVRKMARRFGLPVHAKKDSQEICFIPGKSHNEFLKRYIKMKPGPIKILNNIPSISKGGRREGIIGKHSGLPLYTIGQRRGVEIGGTGPYYVAKLDYKKNILYVVDDVNHPSLYSDQLIAKNVNWISGNEPKLPLQCEAVIRYRHKAVKSKVDGRKSTVDGRNEYVVRFSEPQRAVTPGQSVVFYKKDEVLGGGIIK